MTVRDGRPVLLDVTQVVPGDVVQLRLGEVVPADMRLIEVDDLECDESVLTGESMPVRKGHAPSPRGDSGRVVLVRADGHDRAPRSGHASWSRQLRDRVGRVASLLGRRHPKPSSRSAYAASRHAADRRDGARTAIFVINLLLARPLIEALLFSLAIAVGITPQLLPAIVTPAWPPGRTALAQRKVLVKRLVCIEDLGDIDVLVTDKTGTLTQGAVGFTTALDPAGRPDRAADAGPGLHRPATTDRRGNALDTALWQVPDAATLAGGHTLRASSARLRSTTTAACPAPWSTCPTADAH